MMLQFIHDINPNLSVVYKFGYTPAWRCWRFEFKRLTYKNLPITGFYYCFIMLRFSKTPWISPHRWRA